MNSSKKDNNGWILCPSKSFPGKFYYFNVVNGEAAWSLNDTDQKSLRKDNVLQEADKFHSYPEPSSPPEEFPTAKFGLNIQRTVPNTTRKTFTNIPQMFGQAMFPTYVSKDDPYMQNVIWTPIQLPMFAKPRQDQVTQTFEPERGIVVQTCNIPLSKRFVNYEEPKTVFGSKTEWSQNKNEQTVKMNYFASNQTDRRMTNTQMFGPMSQYGQNRNQPNYTVSNVFCNNNVSNKVKSNPQLFDPKAFDKYSQLVKKFGRQRSQSESDKKVDDTFDNQTFGVSSTQSFEQLAQSSKTSYDYPIKKIGKQRTLFESDCIIFEKPSCISKSTLITSNTALNAIQQNVVSSKSEDQPKSNFVLRKSLFNPSVKVQSTNSQTRSTGLIEKEKRKDSLWCNGDKKENKIHSLLRNHYNLNGKEKDDSLDKLDKTDLRYILEVKRRKSIDCGTSETCLNGNKHKTCELNIKQKETPKKKVTFDLDSETSSEHPQEYNDEQLEHITIHRLRRLADHAPQVWYIVVDTSVVMEDIEFVDKFVQLDKKCKLFIPNAVQSEIENFCFGECRGQQRVIAARQLVRRLAAPPSHFIVQSLENEDYPDMSTLERILNCCLQIMHQRDHVVLFTNDTMLYNKAKSLKIHCYKLQEIKDGASKPEVLKPEPIKITLKNDARQNLFLQKDVSPFPNGKIPSDSCKKTLFTKENSQKSCDVQTDTLLSKDANTSPINYGVWIDESKGKGCDYLNFDFDSDSDTIISKTMKKLDIKDTNSNFMVHKSKKNNLEQYEREGSNTFEINNNNINKTKKCNNNQNLNKESIFNVPKDTMQNLKFQIQSQKETKIYPNSNKSRQLQEKFKSSIQEKLESRFQVTNTVMQKNIRTNIEEWICTFVQIMEYALTALLQDSNPKTLGLAPPWTLHEVLTCIKDVFIERWTVCTVADELSLLLLNNSNKQGSLKPSMKPDEFMRVFGCGLLLVEYLQATEQSPDITEAQQLLQDMLVTMQRGKEEVDLVRTPVPRRSSDDEEESPKPTFMKKSSAVLEYLKKHFPAWQSPLESSITNKEEGCKMVSTRNTGTKVVRTTGRNLKSLTIDKSKSIAMKEDNNSPILMKLNQNNSPVIHISQNTLLSSESTVKLYDIHDELKVTTPLSKKNEKKSGSQSTKHNENNSSEFNVSQNTIPTTESTLKLYEKNEEPKIVRLFDASTPFPKKKDVKSTEKELIFMSPKHGNTFGSREETAGPKVIRNIKLIDSFEEKLKFKVDMDELNYSAIEDTLSNVSECTVIDGNDLSNDKTSFNGSNNDKISYNDSNNDNISIIDQENETDQDDVRTNVDSTNDGHMDIQNNDSSKPNDSSTNDSGFHNENESYVFIQTFLCELSYSMKLIYKFIDESMKEFRKKDLKSDIKKKIADKATTTHGHLTGIIYKLQCIVQREADDVTPLKEIIIKADVVMVSDKRMMRYRQVVMKCLEQAEMLDDALQILLAIAEGDYDATFCLDRSVYFNIFE